MRDFTCGWQQPSTPAWWISSRFSGLGRPPGPPHRSICSRRKGNMKVQMAWEAWAKISLYLFKNLICGPREPRMWRPTAERMRLDCWPESQLCSAGMKGRIHLHSRWLPVLPQINMDPLPPRTLPSPLHLRGLLHSPPPPPSPPVIRVIQT